MATPTKLVDSHQHVRWHQRDEHGLVADLDAHGISYAWLLSWQLSHLDQAPEYNYVFNPVHFAPDGSHPGIPLSDLLDDKTMQALNAQVDIEQEPPQRVARKFLDEHGLLGDKAQPSNDQPTGEEN